MGFPVSDSIPVNKEDKGNNIPTGFPLGAYWKLLHHEFVEVIEPSNPTFKASHASTVLDKY